MSFTSGRFSHWAHWRSFSGCLLMSRFVAIAGFLILYSSHTLAGGDVYYRAVDPDYPGNQFLYSTSRDLACAMVPSHTVAGREYSSCVKHPTNNSACRCTYTIPPSTDELTDQHASVSMFQCATGEDYYDEYQECLPACEPGENWNPITEQCQVPDDECAPGLEENPVTNQCELPCDSQRWDPADGACMPTSCGDDELLVVDPDGACTGDGCGTVVDNLRECVPTGCANVTGKARYDSNFDFCQEKKDECDSRGGTYGAIGFGGDSANNKQVCLKDYASQVPTCVPNSFNYVENKSDGSYAVVCSSVEPPDNVCDAEVADCDGDGNVDDQDGDGIKDNGVQDQHDKGAGGTSMHDPYFVPGAAQDGPADPNNPDPDNTLDPPTDGAGDCDPTAQNYWQCVNKKGGGNPAKDSVNLADISSNIAELKNGLVGENGAFTASQTDIADRIEGEKDLSTSSGDYYTGLSSVPIVAASQNIATAFSSGGACPAPTFDAFGQTFALNYHCTLYAAVSGVLSAAMFAFWSLVGIRHVMSA